MSEDLSKIDQTQTTANIKGKPYVITYFNLHIKTLDDTKKLKHVMKDGGRIVAQFRLEDTEVFLIEKLAEGKIVPSLNPSKQ